MAKEIYNFSKGMVLTVYLAKPIGFAISTIYAELSKGIIQTAVCKVGEAAIGYVSKIRLVRYLYKIAQLEKLKASARLIYKVASFPMTLYSKKVGGAFDLLAISKLEELWFAEHVYIFDDNRLWVENNFTLSEVFLTQSIKCL